MKRFSFFLFCRMCSLVDGALEPNVDEDVQEDQVHPGGKTICQKCRISPPILTLRKKDVYCESCFLTGCHHKFRSTLGKNKAIHFNDRVVVAFSGSQGSLAVLKLIRSSLEDKNNPKKLPYTPFVLIIDESGLCLDHEYSIKDVINLAKIFSFDVHVTHLSTALRQDTCLKSADGYNDEPSTATTGLKELLVKTPETSSKLSLLKELRRQIMLRAAVELKCSKIFTGECATSLAITLLSGNIVSVRATVDYL
jgi:cytoplasmic tRNA 2-thiolation protein 2